jgi:deferrochelatase/peroxidase EfeB
LEVHVAHDSQHPGTARALAPTGPAAADPPATAAGAAAVPLDNQAPLDEAGAAWLTTLQGNILRGHGRTLGLHLFIELPHDAAAAGRLLASLTAAFVTSAARQYEEVVRKRAGGAPGELFGSVALSASGYRRLGRPVASLFPPDAVDEEPVPLRSLFAAGMRASHAALGDAIDTPWESPYGAARIDALLILADHDRDRLHDASARAHAMVAEAGGTVVGLERGRVKRNADGEPVEHFGFVDGRSQPLFLADDFRDKPGAPAPSTAHWHPFEPLGRVLVPDPAMAAADPRCHGSFLVFRKLQQNVRRFHVQLRRIADALDLPGTEAERLDRAGALVVGRFRDGTPIVQQSHPGGDPRTTNDFTYADDVRGGRCPMHAHIRKVNPRGHSLRAGETMEVERRHTIARRSLTYGERRADETPETLPETGVGVLFMCYQASIERQFAFMQQRWCGTAWFPQARVGVDALVGQDDPREILAADEGHANESHDHDWPAHYGADPSARAPCGPCIDTLGGVFLFVPSVPFLQSLG